ncbi:hypothetical protein OB2597_04840 [Pseudooceanicola batsensis HTCC2597]|uniref:Uncharacterized protein n=1 Tax=Pseudooceanicola batsensis (strain ATCC BAA-863 / DSM 15984 / KCTC 12145 / HTCC2597) TaxID=252305 RepID=A3TSF3_PSEBH|nr:hypothetical protein [Pseudooceanicola batsensis]EAQ04580.1 hypothetical protein OB2597_04840 [Pseudooceanicola batsensis HTCC2597]
MMDLIAQRVADALRQARVVGKCLDEKIIPMLETRDRAFAGNISRRIAARDIVSEEFLRDLEAFTLRIEREVEEGTTLIWRGHEHDPDCGYHAPVRTARAGGLQHFQAELVDLASEVEGALNAAYALEITSALLAQ